MVTVQIEEDGQGRPSSFYASGHAGWQKMGKDVVCAAVSCVLQTALLGLTEVAKIDVFVRKGEGKLELAWPASSRDDAASLAIVETAALAMERLATQFPKHVAVERRRRAG